MAKTFIDEIIKISPNLSDQQIVDIITASDNWKSAVYHTDQKPSGPKMKGRFIIRKSILPIESIYRTKLKKTLSEST